MEIALVYTFGILSHLHTVTVLISIWVAFSDPLVKNLDAKVTVKPSAFYGLPGVVFFWVWVFVA